MVSEALAKEALKRLIETGKKVDPVMEKYLLRHVSEAFKEPVLYPIRVGGKRIRPALTLLSAEAAGGPQDKALPAAAAVELTHNYSLILDDIIDHSEKRRGQPTVWKKYGLSIAILVAVHYRESISEALNDTPDPPRFTEILTETIKVLVEGERLDILFEQAGRLDEPYVVEHRYKVVTLDDYMDMVRKKTSVLIRTACMFGAMSVGAPEDLVNALGEYGEALGIAFQVGDDILDLFGKEELTGKKVGQDIVEHKLGNVVVALALDELSGSDRDELLSILRKDVVTYDDAKCAIKLIEEKTSARERAEKLRDEWVKKAIESLAPLPDTEAKRLLEGLAYFVSIREY